MIYIKMVNKKLAKVPTRHYSEFCLNLIIYYIRNPIWKIYV